MPIKPENAKRYPKEWKQIRERILARAKHRCEQCGIHNHDIGYRDEDGEFHVVVKAFEVEGPVRDYQDSHATGYKLLQVVLTVAHLDHIPENCAENNLKAWCQKCHLSYDHAHHQRNSAMTRRANKKTLELPLEETK